ncbi:RNA polymerase sigma factor [Arachidicoccus terrestris]|uniref:RNA polymerase sigma factor n=1 Tax=Arachidicoccus terrestris TaxID=2875539 RepID=UPI001CC48187|nr:sigma-70 family RNA polymerase sigma factor [Arachidicoccus terrestris]UAY56918.1 sigma-70 family RNA polymerase sigma factor [Arachidicoccus terrestris]
MTIDTMFIEKLKADCPKAFETVYNTYAPQLINYSAARLSSLEESRDLVHDVFVSFYERRATLDLNVSVRTYLFAALKYKMIDHIRKNTHRKYYKEMVLSMDQHTEESVFDQTVYNNLNCIMDQEVSRLPGRMRETFILSRQHHLSVTEIAAEMRVSEQTVKNQLSTALKKLRVVLNRIALIPLLIWLLGSTL